MAVVCRRRRRRSWSRSNECDSETAEQILDVPQFAEETVEMVRLLPQERVQWIDEQVVEVFSGERSWMKGPRRFTQERRRGVIPLPSIT